MTRDRQDGGTRGRIHASRFTPGPWHLNEDIRDCLYVESDFAPMPLICDMQLRECVGTGEREMVKANARLIASAPELLDALQYVRKHYAEKHLTANTLCIIDAALAKATGEVTP